MGIAIAILKALSAAWSVWTQERAIANRPEIVKSVAAQNIQTVKDRLSAAEAVLADPSASAEDHLNALREVRLAHSVA